MSADSKVTVETEPEKFDHLHPYPDIYYTDDEDVTDEEDWCFECDNQLEDCTCGICPHGNPDGVDCDRCKAEERPEPESR